MPVSKFENGLVKKPSLSGAVETIGVPTERKFGGPRPPSLTRIPTSPLAALVNQFQDGMAQWFRESSERIQNSLKRFVEGPRPLTPADIRRKASLQELQELSDSPTLPLVLHLLCWGGGLGTEKCPDLLKESLKQYLEKMKIDSK